MKPTKIKPLSHSIKTSDWSPPPSWRRAVGILKGKRKAIERHIKKCAPNGIVAFRMTIDTNIVIANLASDTAVHKVSSAFPHYASLCYER